MGPKKRATQAAAKKQQPRAAASKKRKGILGAATGYNSESDDDYEPSVPKQKLSPAKGNRRRAAKPTPSSSEADSTESEEEGSYRSGATDGSDSSDSGETLAARQQRQRGKLAPAQAAGAGRGGRGRPGKRAAAAAAAAAVAAAPTHITTWDQLPTAVLAQIFQAVCKHGALPMAPKLACVCSSWNAAVAATPELWHILDTAAIPNRSWARAPQGCTVSPAKHGRKKPAAAKQLTAEQGLRLWVTSGRLRELQSLLLYGDGASAVDAGNGSSAGVNRQLSAQLLDQVAGSCQQLRRLSVFGALSMRPEELTSVLLSMPALAELWVSGVRFSAISGLTSCICSVLEASATTGIPKLKSLVVEGCVALGQKVVSALCPSSAAATRPQQPDAAGGHQQGNHPQPHPDHHHQQQHGEQHPAHGLGSPGTAAVGNTNTQAPSPEPRGAAFPHLEVLDLSQSCTILGKPVKLQLDDLQVAIPTLRVLKLSGVGGFYGWTAAVRNLTALPGFPALESLHVDCNVSAVSGLMKVHAGSSNVTDALLLQLAGQSPKLRALDLSGSPVTPAGLRQLAAAHAACRAAAAAAAPGLATCPDTSSGDAVRGGGSAGAAAVAATHAAPASTSAAAAAPAGDAAAVGALHLRDLQIDGSALASDEGLVAIGQCCCDTLEQLVVRGAGGKLGDEGLRGLKACRRLSTLNLTGSSVTEAGMADLLSALPPGVLEDLALESCRSLSRGARQAAAKGVKVLQQYLADNPRPCSNA